MLSHCLPLPSLSCCKAAQEKSSCKSSSQCLGPHSDRQVGEVNRAGQQKVLLGHRQLHCHPHPCGRRGAAALCASSPGQEPRSGFALNRLFWTAPRRAMCQGEPKPAVPWLGLSSRAAQCWPLRLPLEQRTPLIPRLPLTTVILKELTANPSLTSPNEAKVDENIKKGQRNHFCTSCPRE